MRQKLVTCPKCQYAFVADTAASVHCPECRHEWAVQSAGAEVTVVADHPETSADRVPAIVMATPSGAQRIFELKAGTVVIGRTDECDIVIADEQASRQHAKVTLRDGRCVLTDTSSNGTFVGSERVVEQVLGDGDRFRIGQVHFTYHRNGADPADLAMASGRGLIAGARVVARVMAEGWAAQRDISQMKAQRSRSQEQLSVLQQRRVDIVPRLGERVIATGELGRFPDLSRKIGESSTRVAELDGLLVSEERRKQELELRLSVLDDEHGSAIRSLRETSTAHGKLVRKHESELAELEAGLQKKWRRIDKLASELRTASGSPASASGDDTKRRLDVLEGEARSDGGRVDALRSELAVARSNRDVVNGDLGRAERELDEAVAPEKAALEEINGKLDGIASERRAARSARQELVVELGKSAVDERWAKPELNRLVAEHHALTKEVADAQDDVNATARERDLLLPAVRRMRKTALILAGGCVASVAIVTGGLSALSSLLSRPMIDAARAKENVGLVIAYAEYRTPRGTSIEIPLWTGSCFAISEDGVLLTNRHVTNQAFHVPKLIDLQGRLELRNPLICKLGGPLKLVVCFADDPSRQSEAEVLHESKVYDMALMKIDRRFRDPYLISGEYRSGGDIFACGFPGTHTKMVALMEPEWRKEIKEKLGRRESVRYAEWYPGAVFDVSLTRGVISAVNTIGGLVNLQTDARIHHGNSGGPMLTPEGVAIGVNTFGTGQTQEEGTNYAVELAQMGGELAAYAPVR